MGKKEYDIVRLVFPTGFHLSLGKSDNYDRSQTYLRSDTIKSALFTSLLRLCEDDLVKEKLFSRQRYLEDNGKDSFFNKFKVSSAFPFWKNEQGALRYALPLPRLSLQSWLKIEDGEEKKLRKANFIETETLQKIFQGVLTKTTALQLSEGEYKILANEKKPFKLASSTTKQQVQVPHDVREDATPFGVDRVYFRPEAGLYVILEVIDESIRQPLQAAWKLLGEDGIGTDRTTGAGQFIPAFADREFRWVQNTYTNYQMNLSLYWPREKEIDVMSEARYELLRRGGFITQPADMNHLSIRKRAVYMVTEGSLFPNNRTLIGRLGDLRPAAVPLQQAGLTAVDHPVWRDGQALFLPL